MFIPFSWQRLNTMFMNKWYSSPQLLHTSRKGGTYAAETVRGNGKEVKNYKTRYEEAVSGSCNNILAVKLMNWQDVLTSNHLKSGGKEVMKSRWQKWHTGCWQDQVLASFPIKCCTVKGNMKISFTTQCMLQNIILLECTISGRPPLTDNTQKLQVWVHFLPTIPPNLPRPCKVCKMHNKSQKLGGCARDASFSYIWKTALNPTTSLTE